MEGWQNLERQMSRNGQGRVPPDPVVAVIGGERRLAADPVNTMGSVAGMFTLPLLDVCVVNHDGLDDHHVAVVFQDFDID